MKKIIFVVGISCLAVGAWAQAAQQTVLAGPAATATAVQAKPIILFQPTAEQQRIFKQRNQQIRRLVKQYRKVSAAEKPAVKEQLAQLVSQATDESIALAVQRIEAERANLAQWEQKLAERQAHLPEIKAQRVDELLSGEAQRRFKLVKKRWTKEIKAAQKAMK